jgi:hypothetical protein
MIGFAGETIVRYRLFMGPTMTTRSTKCAEQEIQYIVSARASSGNTKTPMRDKTTVVSSNPHGAYRNIFRRIRDPFSAIGLAAECIAFGGFALVIGVALFRLLRHAS